MDSIVTMISTVGFPIIACCAMGWYINNTHSKFTEALNRNTNAIERLMDKIGD